MRTILVPMAILFVCGPILAQQTKQVSSNSITADIADAYGEPKRCAEFDEIAARINAVSTLEEISEAEFRSADEQPDKIVSNPHKVFDIGDVEYFITEMNGKRTFNKSTTHKDKKVGFLRWYNKGGDMRLMEVATSCFLGYSSQVLDSPDREERLAIQMKQLDVLNIVSQAAFIARESDDDLLKSSLQYSSAQSQEIFKLRDRYNRLVEDVNAYNDAVNNLVALVNDMINRQKTSAKVQKFNLNFVRPQPITCTGTTFAISNSTAYLNSLDTVTNATSTIQCQ